MALILNLPIFVQNGGHFVCYHGNGVWQNKIQLFTQKCTNRIKQNLVNLPCLILNCGNKGDGLHTVYLKISVVKSVHLCYY